MPLDPPLTSSPKFSHKEGNYEIGLRIDDRSSQCEVYFKVENKSNDDNYTKIINGIKDLVGATTSNTYVTKLILNASETTTKYMPEKVTNTIAGISGKAAANFIDSKIIDGISVQSIWIPLLGVIHYKSFDQSENTENRDEEGNNEVAQTPFTELCFAFDSSSTKEIVKLSDERVSVGDKVEIVVRILANNLIRIPFVPTIVKTLVHTIRKIFKSVPRSKL